MQQDIIQKLRETQRHLVEIARACDAASIHLRTVLREMNAGQEDAKPANENEGGENENRD